MLKRITLMLQLSALALFLFACDSNNDSTSGRLDIEKNLRISNIEVDVGDFDPEFDESFVGPYEFSVDNDVENIEITIGDLRDTDLRTLAYRQVPLTSDNRRGREDEQDIEPNVPFQISLVEGDNTIKVRVQSPGGEQFLEYSLLVQRESSNALLQAISFNPFGFDFSLNDPDSFDPEVFDYTVSVGYELCTLGIRLNRPDRNATLFLNEMEVENATFNYVDLSVGENIITADVLSEDESTMNRYTFTVTRAAPDENDLNADSTLSTLAINPGRLEASSIEGFRCLFRFADTAGSTNNSGSGTGAPSTIYTARINDTAENVSFIGAPSDTRRGAVIGVVATDDDGNFLVSDSGFPVLEDTVVLDDSEPAVFPVASGSANWFGVSLVLTSESERITQYLIRVTRSETNWVEVSNGSELQMALKEALPNQEIVLEAGDYTGLATEEASGKEGTLFYSAMSGTEDQPIILRGDGIVNLSGLESGAETLLELSGNHWEVFNLAFRDAPQGMILDAADDNSFNSLLFTDLEQRALEIRNGSDRNSLTRLLINGVGANLGVEEIGGEAIVVGSPAEQWSTNPVPGPFEPINEENKIGSSIIGPNVKGPLIVVNEGSVGAQVAFTTLDSENSENLGEISSPVVNRGNETEFSYLTLFHDSDVAISEFINVRDIDEEWETIEWGDSTAIFDSIFDFGGRNGIDAVAADDSVSTVSVDDNVRDDGGELTYRGDAIDTNFQSPQFLIASAENPELCLERELVDTLELDSDGDAIPGNVTGEVLLILANTCDAANSAQLWDLENEKEATVLIRDSSPGTGSLAPADAGNFNILGSSILTLIEDQGSDVDQSGFLRWFVNITLNHEVVLTNRFDNRFAVTLGDMANNFDTDAQGAFLAFSVGVDSQRFRLVPVE